MQRSLAFVPGKWDPEMASDAASSNDFRQSVWTLWRREYFPVHPWLGRGFGFRSDWSKVSLQDQSLYGTQVAVETGNMHNGFFASLDAFGILGTLFFVIWNGRLFVKTFRVPEAKDHPEGVALRLVALYLAVSITSFWIGAQGVGTFLPQEFALAAVLVRLQREIASRSIPVRFPKPQLEMHSTRLATA
jgi:O-antigen ligase